MTLDEAIKHAEEVAEEQENKFSISGEYLGNNADCKKCAKEYRQLAEWLKDYKRLLEQQPCEDVISRKAVFNAIEQEDKWLLSAKGHNGLTEIAFSGLKARVDALPSVTQKSAKDYLDMADRKAKKIKDALTVTQKSGKWIRWYEMIESADGKITEHIPHCKCSECGKEYDPHSSQFIKYCSKCGAKMQESKETGEIHCNHTDTEIAKSFIEDVEAVKELLPKAGK